MKLKSPLIAARPRLAQRGGTTVAVLGFIVVMSLIFGTVLPRSMNAYRQVSYIASWQEALLAAEAASDIAVAELRKSINDPGNAFSGWIKTAADGTPLPNGEMRYTCPPLTHAGEGNTKLEGRVALDAPPQLRDASGRQWFRIRATGTTFLSGAARITADKRDHPLRRLSFHWDSKTRSAVARPQSSRLVELLVKPTGFENALTSDLPISINNWKVDVDSYDSRDNTKSTDGLYDPAKRQQNGDIATNSQLIEAGSADVYGDAYTNEGVIQNGANIRGEQRSDFYQELLPVQKPEWAAVPVFPITANDDMTLVCGTKATPTRYKLNDINLASKILTFAPTASGVESYCEIWVTGDLKTTGNGSVVIQPNCNVKIFLEGNVDIKGNGTFNANSQPVRLQVLGVKPPGGQTRTMNFNGNGIFVGAVYAPNADITYGGAGSSGTCWGSLTGRSITMGGTAQFHYDEALSDLGQVTDYKIASWFEDAK